jgi:carbamoyltransferase
MYIIGLNLGDDRSACLLKDGKIIVAILEERLDRIKKSPSIYADLSYRLPPYLSINYCLNAAGINIDELDLIVANHDREPVNIERLKQLLPIKDKTKIIAPPHPAHHLVHAFSSYFCSPFTRSLVLVYDSFGSDIENKGNEGESVYIASKNNIKHLSTNYQNLYLNYKNKPYFSLTYIYRFVSLALGFCINVRNGPLKSQIDEAGKTMGLAPYGRFVKEWVKIVKVNQGHLDTSNFTKFALETGIGQVKNNQLEPVIVRKPKEQITSFHKNLAFKIQSEFEEGILFLLKKAMQETQIKNVCLAGGGALNCVLNQKIAAIVGVDRLFIQPAASDDGTAIGAALYGWHRFLKQKKRFELNNVFFGKTYTSKRIRTALNSYYLSRVKPENKNKLFQKVAQEIERNKIVGWFRGGSEFGPRALGHRSILANPSAVIVKDLINKKVKNRESFRPFAPSVLAERINNFFNDNNSSPYMLLAPTVNKTKQSLVKAVLHIDNSARVQTVNRADNPAYWALINEFYKLTKIPLILNTSFNTNGAPIVETPEEALEAFLVTDMDYLVLENFILDKNDLEVKKAIAIFNLNKEGVTKRVKQTSGLV